MTWLHAATQLTTLIARAQSGDEASQRHVQQAFGGIDMFDAMPPLLERTVAYRKHLHDATPHGGAHVEAELAALDVDIARGLFSVAKSGGVL